MRIKVARGIAVKACNILYLKNPPKGEIINPKNRTTLQIIQLISAFFLTSGYDVSMLSLSVAILSGI